MQDREQQEAQASEAGSDEIGEIWAQLKSKIVNCDAPYSGYRVASCLVTPKGRFFGCNFENVSYPAGLCAESSAVAAMIAQCGPQPISRVYIYSPSNAGALSPCGVCLQRLSAYVSGGAEVIAFSDKAITMREKFSDLFRKPFRIE